MKSLDFRPGRILFWLLRRQTICQIPLILLVMLLDSISVGAINNVSIESKTVRAGQANVKVGICIDNDVELDFINLPLEIRSVSNDAYIQGTFTLTTTNRITSICQQELFVLQYHSTPDPNNSCSGPVSLSWTQNPSGQPNADGTPDAVVWAWFSLEAGCYFPAGSDGYTASIVLTFDVNDNIGEFEIDTACVGIDGHLLFIDKYGNQIVPNFTKGIITIKEPTLAIWPECACLEPGPNQDKISSTFGPRALFGSAFHQGIDIAIPAGGGVHSIVYGKVNDIEERSSGTIVRVLNGYPGDPDQSGMLTDFSVDYEHLDRGSIVVNRLDIVDPGALIGNVGGPYPGTSGAHLHMKNSSGPHGLDSGLGDGSALSC